jgi:hypothetical protein
MKVVQRNKLDRFNDDGRKRTRHTEITLATWNKRSSSAGSEKMDRVGDRQEKWRGIVRQAKTHSGL